MNSRFFRAAFLVAAVMVAFGALAGITAAASPPGTAAIAPAPHRVAAVACSWEQFDSLGRANAFAAGAYNGTAHTVFTYGGLNSNDEPGNDVQEIHFPDADVNNAQPGMVGGASGAKDLFGAAGAHDGGTVAWFVGGGNAAGDGTDFVQNLDQSGMNPVFNGTVAAGGQFSDRLFAAAAFEPGAGALVVNGGAETCTAAVPPEDAGDDCVAGNFSGSNVLTIDATSGAASWDRLSGGPDRRFGGTLVYDSMGDRILSFGGTDDGSRGKGGVMALNTSDADWTKWTWGNLPTAGTAPADRFLHSAAYDSVNNWMIVYGGVRSNAFETNESALQDTFALDLGQTPAMWVNLGASLASSSVGSQMSFDTATGKAILTGGRRQGSSNTTGNAYALTCAEVVPTPVTPTTAPRATNTPGGGGGGTAVPQPTLDPNAGLAACTFLTSRAPAAAINEAVANPAEVFGYGQLCFPNVPPSPFNGLRNKLSLRSPAVPYHPLYNGLVWSCGCP